MAVTELRQQANRLGLKDLNAIGSQVKISPVELTEADQVRLSHLFPGLRFMVSSKLLTVPSPNLTDQPMIDWVWAFLARVFPKEGS